MFDGRLLISESATVNNLLTYLPDKRIVGLLVLAACTSVVLGTIVSMVGKRLIDSHKACDCIAAGLVKTFIILWSFIAIICFVFNAIASGFLSLGVLLCLLMVILVKGH
jgi:uncharacterized membrane protein YhaH (DUF805 family)